MWLIDWSMVGLKRKNCKKGERSQNLTPTAVLNNNMLYLMCIDHIGHPIFATDVRSVKGCEASYPLRRNYPFPISAAPCRERDGVGAGWVLARTQEDPIWH